MGEQKRALVVDDEEDSRAFVRAILESDEWEVAEAADGEAGLEQIVSSQPDLVVLDVQMPKKDGFEVWGDLIAKKIDISKTKFIMLTGIADKVGTRFSGGDMGEFYGREPDAYVEKPVDPETLQRVVREVTSTE
jgi:two-component system alkaline phosphatase synthesis response regulator PhoP